MAPRLVILAALLLSGPVLAGYAQMSPPAGWSSGGSLGATYKAAANESWSASQTVRTSASLNVAGRSVTMPVALRLSAANAPRFLAARIGSAMVGGPVGAGLTLLSLLAIPLVKQWTDGAGVWWDEPLQKWKIITPTSSKTYTPRAGGGPNVASLSEACLSGFGPDVVFVRADRQGSSELFECVVRYPGFTSDSVAGYVSEVVAEGGATVRVAEFHEVETALSAQPLPPGLPNILPFEWPVGDPILNPTPEPELLPRPVLVPLGDPVPVPNSDPAQQEQPLVRVNPSPTPLQPWRVDLRPEKTVSPLGTPALPDPSADPAVTPGTDPATEPRPDTEGLCEKYPDILACQKPKLGDVKEIKVPNTDKQVQIAKSPGFGPADAQCPAPQQLQLSKMTIALPWDLVCSWATMMRPLLIAFAWLGAAGMLFGVARND